MAKFEYYHTQSILDKATNSLNGALKSMTSDGVIDDSEVLALKSWADDNSIYSHLFPFNELTKAVYKILEDGIIDEEEKLDLLWLCNQLTSESGQYYDVVTCGIQQLHGLMEGALVDGKLEDKEILYISEWIKEHDDLKGMYPFDELHAYMHSILEDGVISDDEKKLLMRFFMDFSDMTRVNLNADQIETLKKEVTLDGIFTKDPCLTINGNTYCFTGESEKTTRTGFQNIVESLGCNFSKNVTKKVDYLVVGVYGSAMWSFATYGRKVEDAVNLRKAGHPIQIVNEQYFWSLMDSQGAQD